MKIGEIEYLHNVFEFHMDADHFCILHRGTRYYFEDFGTEGTMTGFLTCKPDEVSQVLKIPAK